MPASGIFLLLGVFIVVFAGILLMMKAPFGGGSQQMRSNFRNLVSSQRPEYGSGNGEPGTTSRRVILPSGEEDSGIPKVADSRLTLRKKLKFSQWQNIPPYVFSVAQITISLCLFLVVRKYFGLMLQLPALMAGPIVMNGIIMRRVNKRYEQFDKDYPQFLLSMVGLLKTGMNPIQALEAVAQGMEEGSLVKIEVELMLERLRLGVPEERSVGSFGEDVFHPEIELFVQALILSRRVGGTLSDTLERLAKQVRKRQYFRHSANAAVGLQRGSIWAIIGILVGMQLFLFLGWRDVLIDLWFNPLGHTVLEGSLFAIILGLWWVKQVTKIRT